MTVSRRIFVTTALGLPLLSGCVGAGRVEDVRNHGARGDGRALDHAAINAAIAAAARQGGGTVSLPAGRYLCFSIHLQSNVTLRIEAGAVIEAADPERHAGSYDLPETTEHDVYQDFGHSHFHNSLIWGDGVENVAIMGSGRIEGVGLTRTGPGPRWLKAGSHPNSMTGFSNDQMRRLEPDRSEMNGKANKAIALRNSRRITLRDFSILKGGHFAILLTGVDDLTIDNLSIDTDRDGVDIDACRRVRVVNCRVNSPNDDAIVLKSSLALGSPRATENVIISRCNVSGYDMGTLLDGTRTRVQDLSPDHDRVTGRVKLGTESNGGFRSIHISDCVFDRCRGLALESVDGGVLEDVKVANLKMTDITTAPLFLRCGDRRRGPEGTPLAKFRNVSIANVTATGIDRRYAASIAGLVDSPVEDVAMSNIRLQYAGGGTAEDAQRAIPESRDSYPEPSTFGVLPAYGLYVRHARGVRIDGLELRTATPDARPPIVFDDARDVRISRLVATGTPVLIGSQDIHLDNRAK
jgi:polygalacturonase